MRVILSSTGLRRHLLHVLLEQVADLFRILVRHQPHADLRHRHGRQHRLRAFAGESRQQAVHFEGRPRPHALERGVAGFAKQLRRAELRLVFLLVERQLLPLGALFRPKLDHIVIEAVDLDAAALVFICASTCASTIAGFATAPPNDPECRSDLLPRRSIWK
jgi:hypothetical protein